MVVPIETITRVCRLLSRRESKTLGRPAFGSCQMWLTWESQSPLFENIVLEEDIPICGELNPRP